jgi:two-component system, sensor histidine kinase PdtaS
LSDLADGRQTRRRQNSSDRWESEGMMPLQHTTPSKVSLSARSQDLKPRTVASYERELAEAKVTESELRRLLAQDQILLGQKDESIRHQKDLNYECHHRLLNNLQMIASLLSLQSRSETNTETSARLSVAADRVKAVGHLHRHLHSMDSTETVEFKQYLDELCRDHSTISMSKERPTQDITVQGVEMSLPTVTGIPLGLIANELVTNAIKHGEGRITVKLAPHARNGYALSVCNKGPALPAGFAPAACDGLGMKLVSSFVRQIGGELRIDRGDGNDCTRFTVLFGRDPDLSPRRS